MIEDLVNLDWHWLDVSLGSPGARPEDCKKGPMGLHLSCDQFLFIYSLFLPDIIFPI